jgi:hypothetical protein
VIEAKPAGAPQEFGCRFSERRFGVPGDFPCKETALEPLKTPLIEWLVGT